MRVRLSKLDARAVKDFIEKLQSACLSWALHGTSEKYVTVRKHKGHVTGNLG